MKRPLLTSCLCLIIAQSTFADAKKWREQKRKEIEQEIKQIESRIKINEATLKEAGSKFAQMEKDLADIRETAENAKEPVQNAAQALKDTGDALDSDTRTSDPELVKLNDAVKQAQAKHDAAAAPVLAAMREQPDYQTAANQLASSQRWLAQMREHPDPESQASNLATASREVMEAQARVRTLESEALAGNSEVVAARAVVDEATAAVVSYRNHKFEDGTVAGDDSRLAELRKDYHDAQKSLQEATKRRSDAEATFRRFQQAGKNLEQSIADDKALVASKKQELKKLAEKK